MHKAVVGDSLRRDALVVSAKRSIAPIWSSPAAASAPPTMTARAKPSPICSAASSNSDEGVLRHIQERFRRFGRSMPEINRAPGNGSRRRHRIAESARHRSRPMDRSERPHCDSASRRSRGAARDVRPGSPARASQGSATMSACSRATCASRACPNRKSSSASRRSMRYIPKPKPRSSPRRREFNSIRASGRAIPPKPIRFSTKW